MIGLRIRELRKERNVSQAQLAEETDLSVSFISYIESGSKTASLDSVIKIAEALGVTVNEILAGNQLYDPVEYQTDMDVIMADCDAYEKRIIYELAKGLKYSLKSNRKLFKK